jgi:hypothetical protein
MIPDAIYITDGGTRRLAWFDGHILLTGADAIAVSEWAGRACELVVCGPTVVGTPKTLLGAYGMIRNGLPRAFLKAEGPSAHTINDAVGPSIPMPSTDGR